ncbi:6-carboxytetrahydropterin synthase [Marinobacterium arenosum]|uniref:6-carboxytetrahydropterin synthase n=1 Tax=Marinobacterium arenosum TaxID=2862496 RepID=UPI001C970CC2|nr:6-carboxytetrahydropterin synthase [Marinobacterium arenosum]MBY4678282.1 6-carboxytetrahydropterin synthase [Marinobacterium arenosum]
MKLFVENLTNVDFSYLHPQRGLLGESWLVQLELDGSLNEEGMICDFGIVKKRVKQWFDTTIDHALVVPTGMPRLSIQQADGYTRVDWLYADGLPFHCRAPEQAIALVGVPEINEHTLASWCREQLLALFPEQVKGLSLSFVPERIDGAFYHYSHGLEKHDGNCQRIAHGHRSKIEIYLDDQRDEALEARWADTLRDIYIGTEAHLDGDIGELHHYAYRAPQGEFELSLPARCCYLMDTETTVELIASHLAGRIKQQHPDAQVLVRAFEGVGKGAIATA